MAHAEVDAGLLLAAERARSSLHCRLCRNFFDSPQSLPCGHCFCAGCIQRQLYKTDKCPVCSSVYQPRELVRPLVLENLVTTFRKIENSLNLRQHQRLPLESGEPTYHESKDDHTLQETTLEREAQGQKSLIENKENLSERWRLPVAGSLGDISGGDSENGRNAAESLYTAAVKPPKGAKSARLNDNQLCIARDRNVQSLLAVPYHMIAEEEVERAWRREQNRGWGEGEIGLLQLNGLHHDEPSNAASDQNHSHRTDYFVSRATQSESTLGTIMTSALSQIKSQQQLLQQECMAVCEAKREHERCIHQTELPGVGERNNAPVSSEYHIAHADEAGGGGGGGIGIGEPGDESKGSEGKGVYDPWFLDDRRSVPDTLPLASSLSCSSSSSSSSTARKAERTGGSGVAPEAHSVGDASTVGERRDERATKAIELSGSLKVTKAGGVTWGSSRGGQGGYDQHHRADTVRTMGTVGKDAYELELGGEGVDRKRRECIPMDSVSRAHKRASEQTDGFEGSSALDDILGVEIGREGREGGERSGGMSVMQIERKDEDTRQSEPQENAVAPCLPCTGPSCRDVSSAAPALTSKAQAVGVGVAAKTVPGGNRANEPDKVGNETLFTRSGEKYRKEDWKEEKLETEEEEDGTAHTMPALLRARLFPYSRTADRRQEESALHVPAFSAVFSEFVADSYAESGTQLLEDAPAGARADSGWAGERTVAGSPAVPSSSRRGPAAGCDRSASIAADVVAASAYSILEPCFDAQESENGSAGTDGTSGAAAFQRKDVQGTGLRVDGRVEAEIRRNGREEKGLETACMELVPEESVVQDAYFATDSMRLDCSETSLLLDCAGAPTHTLPFPASTHNRAFLSPDPALAVISAVSSVSSVSAVSAAAAAAIGGASSGVAFVENSSGGADGAVGERKRRTDVNEVKKRKIDECIPDTFQAEDSQLLLSMSPATAIPPPVAIALAPLQTQTQQPFAAQRSTYPPAAERGILTTDAATAVTSASAKAGSGGSDNDGDGGGSTSSSVADAVGFGYNGSRPACKRDLSGTGGNCEYGDKSTYQSEVRAGAGAIEAGISREVVEAKLVAGSTSSERTTRSTLGAEGPVGVDEIAEVPDSYDDRACSFYDLPDSDAEADTEVNADGGAQSDARRLCNIGVDSGISVDIGPNRALSWCAAGEQSEDTHLSPLYRDLEHAHPLDQSYCDNNNIVNNNMNSYMTKNKNNSYIEETQGKSSIYEENTSSTELRHGSGDVENMEDTGPAGGDWVGGRVGDDGMREGRVRNIADSGERCRSSVLCGESKGALSRQEGPALDQSLLQQADTHCRPANITAVGMGRGLESGLGLRVRDLRDGNAPMRIPAANTGEDRGVDTGTGIGVVGTGAGSVSIKKPRLFRWDDGDSRRLENEDDSFFPPNTPSSLLDSPAPSPHPRSHAPSYPWLQGKGRSAQCEGGREGEREDAKEDEKEGEAPAARKDNLWAAEGSTYFLGYGRERLLTTKRDAVSMDELNKVENEVEKEVHADGDPDITMLEEKYPGEAAMEEGDQGVGDQEDTGGERKHSGEGEGEGGGDELSVSAPVSMTSPMHFSQMSSCAQLEYQLMDRMRKVESLTKRRFTSLAPISPPPSPSPHPSK